MRPVFRAVVLSMIFAVFANAAESGTAKVETLSRHETVAKFRGTTYHRCLGMTSLCPDECGSSGTLATFKIVSYVKYEKLGEYGDPKSEEFSFLVEDNKKNPKVSAAIRDAVSALKEGEAVLLSWNHDYVTIDGNSGPERPVTGVEVISPIGTKKWLDQVDRRAVVRAPGVNAPVIGSDEWMRAVSINLGVFDSLGHGPTADSEEWRNAVQWKAFGIRPPASEATKLGG